MNGPTLKSPNTEQEMEHDKKSLLQLNNSQTHADSETAARHISGRVQPCANEGLLESDVMTALRSCEGGNVSGMCGGEPRVGCDTR